MGCFLDDLRVFGINADQWTTAAQDEGGWCRTAEQGVGRFMVKLIAADKTRAGLRHAAVCPNMTGRTKERKAQSKRARAGSLTLVDYLATSGANSYPPGGCRGVFLWCYVCFVLFRFRLFAFTEAVALRLILLRSLTCMRPDSHTQNLLARRSWPSYPAPALSFSTPRLNLVRTRGSSRFPLRRPSRPSTAIGSVTSLSGHAHAYRWRLPPGARRHKTEVARVTRVAY